MQEPGKFIKHVSRTEWQGRDILLAFASRQDSRIATAALKRNASTKIIEFRSVDSVCLFQKIRRQASPSAQNIRISLDLNVATLAALRIASCLRRAHRVEMLKCSSRVCVHFGLVDGVRRLATERKSRVHATVTTGSSAAERHAILVVRPPTKAPPSYHDARVLVGRRRHLEAGRGRNGSSCWSGIGTRVATTRCSSNFYPAQHCEMWCGGNAVGDD